MSRIGRLPVPVPSGVDVVLTGSHIRVTGTRGTLERLLAPSMLVRIEDSTVTVNRPTDTTMHRSLHGLTRTLIANMVEGVTKGFAKQLELVGVGYKAEKRPYGLQLSLGYSHVIEYKAPKGITLSAPVPTQINVEGSNKEVVGQVAAEIRSLRPPEPYKGKGVKYVGEQVRRKAGKAGGK